MRVGCESVAVQVGRAVCRSSCLPSHERLRHWGAGADAKIYAMTLTEGLGPAR